MRTFSSFNLRKNILNNITKTEDHLVSRLLSSVVSDTLANFALRVVIVFFFYP